MSEEQHRAAQRIDLAEPVPAKFGDIEAKVVDISLVGCRIEHAERLSMGAAMTLRFQWKGEAIDLRAKVARTEMRSIGGKMMYSTGLQYATSVDESPEPIRKLMASLVKKSVAAKPEAPIPIFFERAPFFRDEEPDDEPKPRPVAAPPKSAPAPPPPKIAAAAPPKPAVAPPPPPPPPAPTPAQIATATAIAMSDGEQYADAAGPDFELDFSPAAMPTHYEYHAEPVVASQSFELEGEQLLTVDDIAIPDIHAEPAFDLDFEGMEPRYVRCSFENGTWEFERTPDARQPREGFTILDPGDQREIDQFCKTYEYADPETRRMIRVSCELTIAQ